MADSNIRILAPERTLSPAKDAEKRELGPNQRAWLNARIPVFADAEKRAQEAIADTERTRKEARP